MLEREKKINNFLLFWRRNDDREAVYGRRLATLYHDQNAAKYVNHGLVRGNLV